MAHMLQRLGAFRVRALQHIAFLAGLPSTGTKSQLLDDLAVQLPRSRLPSSGRRVLSVDMGIRNLAFCVLDIPEAHVVLQNGQGVQDVLQVSAWKRLDLLDQLSSKAPITAEANDDNLSTKSLRNGRPSADAFTPANLSKTAFAVTIDLLSYNPTTILLERQRHRSGGGSAIQEWTVRVNMLESMIWACLETHKMLQAEGSHIGFPMCHEISPKRVARFWTTDPAIELRYMGGDIEDLAMKSKDAQAPPLSRKIDKKEKIDVVRTWLRGEGSVVLNLTPDTQHVADAFITPSVGRRKRKKVLENDSSVAHEIKLDDLSDCLLQGAAMVRWERNRRNLWRSLE